MNLDKNKIMGDNSSVLSKNLSRLLNTFDITEYDLSKSLGIPYNTINRIITGITTDPRISTLEQIADYFGVKLDFLLDKNNSHLVKMECSVPILTWDFLSHPDFLNKIDRDTWDKWIPVAQLIENSSFDKTFALESTKSMQPRFPSGTTFIIRTSELPVDGDLILVRFKAENSISLRELIIDSPDWRLNPIVTGSQTLLFSHLNHVIIGVVILTLIQTRNI
jgi:transcriptional regulator with XRE-family HTH domain